MISTVQAQWNSATMRVQIEKACAAEAIWRLELGKVRRTAEPLPAKVRRGEIDFRLRAGGTIPSLKSRLSNRSSSVIPSSTVFALDQQYICTRETLRPYGSKSQPKAVSTCTSRL